tara:strand:- start:154 stop:318 length:165 start_codon:yes stop_codon:yes gene_type:complete
MERLAPDLIMLSIIGIYSLAILLFNKSAQKPEQIRVKSKKSGYDEGTCSKKSEN